MSYVLYGNDLGWIGAPAWKGEEFQALARSLRSFKDCVLSSRMPQEQTTGGLSSAQLGEILTAVQNGEPDRFSQIIDSYYPVVFGVTRSMIPASCAKEVAHESFVRIFEALPSYREQGQFVAWIRRITVRCAYDYWREKRRRKEVNASADEVLDILGDSMHSEHVPPEQTLHDRKIAALALSKLPHDERILFTLLYLEEWSVAETASALGWSETKTKVKAHRAKKYLRRALKAACDEGDL